MSKTGIIQRGRGRQKQIGERRKAVDRSTRIYSIKKCRWLRKRITATLRFVPEYGILDKKQIQINFLS